MISAFLITTMSFGQNVQKTAPSSEVAIETHVNASEEALLKVQFESHRSIPAYKVALLEERFRITFPDLRSIVINTEEQTITLELPKFNSKVTIHRIMTYFNTTSYETL